MWVRVGGGGHSQTSGLVCGWEEKGVRRGLPNLEVPVARPGCDFAQASAGRGIGDCVGLAG